MRSDPRWSPRHPPRTRSLPALRALLCLLLVLAAAPLAGAVPVLHLSPDDTGPALAAHLAVLEDPGGQLSLDDVARGRATPGFHALDDRGSNFGVTRAAFWLRLRVQNTGPSSRDLVLRQSYAMLDHLDVHVLRAGRTAEQWRTGDRLPFASRPIAHRDFLFPLPLAPGEEVEVYLRAWSDGPVNVALTLSDEQALLPVLGAEQLALGALFGSFALLAMCTALLYAFVRDAAFAYYVCYILAYGAYMAVFNGLGYQYLFPDSPDLAGVAQVVLLMLALHFLLLFSRSILRVRGRSPLLDRAHVVLQAIIFALMLAAPFASYAVLVTPISLTVAATILMVVAIGITGFRAGQPAAAWFLLAWSVFLVGVLAYLLKVFLFLPHNVFTQYGFQIGTVFEFVLLTVALGIRVKEIRQQSRTDSLTGLANRSRFDEIIEQAFAQHRGQGTPLSLLVLDVDHFKRVNDSHGHAIGDRVLEAVGDALRRSVDKGHATCRYGGEEFVVVMPRTELDEALAQAERIRAALAPGVLGVRVTVSIGVACTRGQRFADPRGLFRAADEALYTAKRTGRDRVVAWSGGPGPEGPLRAAGAGPAAP